MEIDELMSLTVDKFEEKILIDLISLSPGTAEKMIKSLPSEPISNKLLEILREEKINQIIK